MQETAEASSVSSQISDFKQKRLNSLVMILIIMTGISIFLSLVNLLFIHGVASRKIPTLVQLETGETIKIGFEDPSYRSPEVIQRYVSDTLYFLMTMTAYGFNETHVSSLDENRKLAEPIKINVDGRSGQITQSAWVASETLEAAFADKFRAKLAEITPRDVFTGKEEVILKLDYVKKPVELLDRNDRWIGRWQVDVVGTLKVYRKNSGEVKSIPFNKRVIVRPINTPVVTNVERFGNLAATINRISQSGLQIVDISDLKVSDVF